MIGYEWRESCAVSYAEVEGMFLNGATCAMVLECSLRKRCWWMSAVRVYSGVELDEYVVFLDSNLIKGDPRYRPAF